MTINEMHKKIEAAMQDLISQRGEAAVKASELKAAAYTMLGQDESSTSRQIRGFIEATAFALARQHNWRGA